MFDYQQHETFFGQIAGGLEPTGCDELLELGAANVRPAFRGVFFEADLETFWRINYQARLFTRFLAPLLRFDCHSTKYLYRRARELPWETLFNNQQTFAVQALVSDSTVRHSRYAALCLKDAIVDRFRELTGARPDVEPHDPDAGIHLYLHENRAVISLDASGGSLHRRGYRKASVEAPMQETVAAAIIRATGWKGECPLYDPFCGSGTLLFEAWMRQARIPAGFFRKSFGFERLPEFNANRWNEIRAEADAAIQLLPDELLHGSDRDPAAIQALLENQTAFPGPGKITATTQPFARLEPLENALIVTNPPYGIRLGDREKTAELLKEFGDFLKQYCAGSTAWIYFGEPALIKSFGLKPDTRIPLANGGLEGFLCRYELFSGLRKKRFAPPEKHTGIKAECQTR